MPRLKNGRRVDKALFERRDAMLNIIFDFSRWSLRLTCPLIYRNRIGLAANVLTKDEISLSLWSRDTLTRDPAATSLRICWILSIPSTNPSEMAAVGIERVMSGNLRWWCAPITVAVSSLRYFCLKIWSVVVTSAVTFLISASFAKTTRSNSSFPFQPWNVRCLEKLENI